MNKEEIYNKIYEDSKKYLNEFCSGIKEYWTPMFETYMKNEPDDIIDEINKKLDMVFEERMKNMSDYEYLEFVAEYPSDVISIQDDFEKYGFNISAAQAEYAWCDRSDTVFACWLFVRYSPFIEWFVHCIIGIV